MLDRLVRFQLFGQEFTFYSNSSEEEVEAVINLLRQELESDEKVSRSSVPSSKMLVLSCLRMASKYVHLHREYEEYRSAEEAVIGRLLQKISSEAE